MQGNIPYMDDRFHTNVEQRHVQNYTGYPFVSDSPCKYFNTQGRMSPHMVVPHVSESASTVYTISDHHMQEKEENILHRRSGNHFMQDNLHFNVHGGNMYHPRSPLVPTVYEQATPDRMKVLGGKLTADALLQSSLHNSFFDADTGVATKSITAADLFHDYTENNLANELSQPIASPLIENFMIYDVNQQRSNDIPINPSIHTTLALCSPNSASSYMTQQSRDMFSQGRVMPTQMSHNVGHYDENPGIYMKSHNERFLNIPLAENANFSMNNSFCADPHKSLYLNQSARLYSQQTQSNLMAYDLVDRRAQNYMTGAQDFDVFAAELEKEKVRKMRQVMLRRILLKRKLKTCQC